jgi:integrase
MAMLRDAIAEGYSVPASLFEASKSKGEAAKATGPARAALEVPQAVAVLGQAAQQADYARWVAGFYQGPRQGETLGLTWDAVDLDRGLITLMWQLQPLPYLDKTDRDKGFRIPRQYEARHLVGRFHLVRPKTRAGWRVAPMTDEFHDALTRWREVWPENPHGLIWARDNGWPIDKADDAEAFRDLQRAAGVRKGQTIDDEGNAVDLLYTGHEMRNTCATILTLAGVDPATITAILGHSSWSTSLGYVTSQLDRMRAALKDVNAAYQPKELG